MRIHNIRYGHATNSSSSHSFVRLRPGAPTHEVEPAHGPFCFGWDHFVLLSKEAKLRYLATALYSNLLPTLGEESARLLVRGLINVDLQTTDAYIDHQSHVGLPRNRKHPHMVDLAFFRSLVDAMLWDDVAILGGNDNEDDYWKDCYGDSFAAPVYHFGEENAIARHDPEYDTWTLFNTQTGKKVRFSWQDKKDPERTSLPELVDIKITDYCDQECAFCYQGSHRQGQHARLDSLRRLSYALQKLGVFEVAIGGGDPTAHPSFSGVLHTFRNADCVVNFSTRNLAWLHDKRYAEAILPLVGAFAYSARSASEVEAFADVARRRGVAPKRAHVQIIPRTITKYELRHILTTAARLRHPVTMLGYKSVGRGATYLEQQRRHTQNKEEAWVEVVKELGDDCPRIGIDTVLAQRYQQQLDELGVPRYLYYVTEGTFSMYCDGVESLIGPSSFYPKEQLVQVKKDQHGTALWEADHLQEVFRSFQTEE